MKIAFGCDHSAVDMKNEIIKFVEGLGHEAINHGTDTGESVHYPVFAKKVGEAVNTGQCDLGILICGTGIGMSIAANKIKGIRAVVCSEPYSARLSREHNNSNVLCFGARVVGSEMAKMIVETWLGADFQGGRHAERVGMLE